MQVILRFYFSVLSETDCYSTYRYTVSYIVDWDTAAATDYEALCYIVIHVAPIYVGTVIRERFIDEANDFGSKNSG